MANKSLSPAELDELAADARAILNNPAFIRAFDKLERQYVDQLKAANIGDLTVPALHASMRVLEDVRGTLTSFINDAKFKRG